MNRDEALKLLRGGLYDIVEWNGRREAGEPIPGLAGVDLSGADLAAADLSDANLSSANLSHATLITTNLRGANLTNARLEHSQLILTALSTANLSGANLYRACLGGADLTGADLSETNLRFADFDVSILQETEFAGATFGRTVIDSDLSGALGLELALHVMPSVVSLRAILSFKDDLPENFLRDCGVPGQDIAYFRSRAGRPGCFDSCFFSYSTKNERFATQLYNDLKRAGVDCYKWDRDARTGQSMWREIDEAMRQHKKVVLIASKASLTSPAVSREIERAILLEDQHEKDKQAGKYQGDVNVLFPVRLDDYIFEDWKHERKVDVTKKVIADARGWDTDPAVYQQVFDKLLRDLKPATGSPADC